LGRGRAPAALSQSRPRAEAADLELYDFKTGPRGNQEPRERTDR
jgi:hypothetical protein